jgi:hypothetical protein
VAGIKGRLPATRLALRKDHLVAGPAEESLRVGDCVGKEEVAETGGEELDAHAMILTGGAFRWAWRRNFEERRLAERCACPSELGPKGEQEGKQRQHQERDFHDQEKHLHQSLFA